MKKIILIFIALSFVSVCFAIQDKHKAVIARKNDSGYPACAASTLWDEFFEGAGYEETWSGGETVDAGGTLDEDSANSDVGSPTGWGSQSLKAATSGAADDAYVRHDFTDDPRQRILIEIAFDSWSDLSVNLEEAVLIKIWTSGWSAVFNLYVRYDSTPGHYEFYTKNWYDGSQNDYDFDTALALDTVYSFEIIWDNTGNVYRVTLDDVEKQSETISADRDVGIFQIGVGDVDNTKDITVYFDRLRICDTY